MNWQHLRESMKYCCPGSWMDWQLCLLMKMGNSPRLSPEAMERSGRLSPTMPGYFGIFHWTLPIKARRFFEVKRWSDIPILKRSMQRLPMKQRNTRIPVISVAAQCASWIMRSRHREMSISTHLHWWKLTVWISTIPESSSSYGWKNRASMWWNIKKWPERVFRRLYRNFPRRSYTMIFHRTVW